MAINKSFYKSFRFPENFKEVYDKFAKIVLLDPELKVMITKHQLSKGFESLGVRRALELYVEQNIHLLIQKAQEKQSKEEIKKNAQTEN